MDVKQKNDACLQGTLELPGLFPQIEELSRLTVQFQFDFGLNTLPTDPGIILVRGARQLGKSTWLELELKKTLEMFGAGSAFYLNGDEFLNNEQLYVQVKELAALFPRDVPVKRIFIDEITAVPAWERALKRLYDAGDIRQLLIITTGSKAVDLRRGTERLPGRKGRLDRTSYLFTPVSYAEFEKNCQAHFGKDVLIAYLLTGGSPLAANELIKTGRIPPYVFALTRDWILGECAAQDRSRNILTWITQEILKHGGNPISLAKLAREAGVANNSVIQGYIDILLDLLSVSVALPVDPNKMRPLPRKSCKFHWVYPLAAASFHPGHIHSVVEFQSLSEIEQGKWFEWLIAQELFRRAAIAGAESPELQFFWQSKDHALDFVLQGNTFLEVKRGQSSPLEFLWFSKVFPKGQLVVVNTRKFATSQITGITVEEFLKDAQCFK